MILKEGQKIRISYYNLFHLKVLEMMPLLLIVFLGIWLYNILPEY